MKNKLRHMARPDPPLYSGLGVQVPQEMYHEWLRSYVTEEEVGFSTFSRPYWLIGVVVRSQIVQHLPLLCKRIASLQRGYDGQGYLESYVRVMK